MSSKYRLPAVSGVHRLPSAGWSWYGMVSLAGRLFHRGEEVRPFHQKIFIEQELYARHGSGHLGFIGKQNRKQLSSSGAYILAGDNRQLTINLINKKYRMLEC